MTKIVGDNARHAFHGELTLDGIGRALEADQSKLVHGYLDSYESILSEIGTQNGRLCLLGARNSERLAKAISLRFPNIFILFLQLTPHEPTSEYLSKCANISRRVVGTVNDAERELVAAGPVDVIIEDGRNIRAEKLEAFKKMFWHIRAGGVYISEDLHAVSIPRLNSPGPELLEEVLGLASDARRLKRDQRYSGLMGSLRDSLESVTVRGRLLFVEKRNTHYLKISEDSVHEKQNLERISGLLQNRELIMKNGAFESRAEYLCNRTKFPERFPTRIDYPELEIRTYQNVTVDRHQVVSGAYSYLPETFRLFRNRKGSGDFKPRGLTNRRIRGSVGKFAEAPREEAQTVLPGEYLHLDSEHMDTFGHATTEIISRTWAYADLVKRYPNLRVLVSSARGEDTASLKPWIIPILEACGIPEDRVTVISGLTGVETLIGVTPLFANLGYVHPEIRGLWRSVRDSLAGVPVKNGDRRLFISRPATNVRQCRNGDEVEGVFVRAGFEVIHPELLPLSEQAKLFGSAKAIAGYGGSAMINTFMCQENVPKLVIAPETYNAINEALISSVLGGNLTYLYCEPDTPAPESGWSLEAFKSSYVFDFETDGAAINRWLASLAA